MPSFDDDYMNPIYVIINGDKILEAFLVNISTCMTVRGLQQAIKDTIARSPKFKHSFVRDVPLEKMQLWTVVVPHPNPRIHTKLEAFEQEEVLLDELKAKHKLVEPNKKMDEVFGGTNHHGNNSSRGMKFVVVKIDD
ncbi:hypothetical protein BGZ95_010541 [Linnemannia exigua]|uniref:Crinkler effector protein N-terminal domain-containing protein n=1 Tax=Linnemannia exigua TaxID=604196 RepID=A0AAD4DB76_9FUNG|nr:hypothetical protein BGZ95_010541 [Linnemannia exigua]